MIAAGCSSLFQVIQEEHRVAAQTDPRPPSHLNTTTATAMSVMLLPAPSSDIVLLHRLKKTYPHTRKAPAVAAVHALTLRISKGEVFGLLGSNGAGKTTTIDMITNVLLPTSGRALVAGVDVHVHPTAAYRVMGYCPQRAVGRRHCAGAPSRVQARWGAGAAQPGRHVPRHDGRNVAGAVRERVGI